MATLQLYFAQKDLAFDIVDGELLIEIPLTERPEFHGGVFSYEFNEYCRENKVPEFALEAAVDAVWDSIQAAEAVAFLFDKAK